MKIIKDSNFPVGIDISSRSVKLVQLKKSKNKIKIQAMGRIDLPPGIIEDGFINDNEKLSQSILNLFSKPQYGQISSNDAIACLPESKTFIRLINVDKTPNNINNIITNEIEKYIPLGLDEIFYDWQVINENNNTLDVLIGAAPKNIVNQYSELYNSLGISINAFEIESVSICRSLLTEESLDKKNKKGGNYAIIDIGAMKTNFTAYSNNTILFSLNLPISGEKITKKIAKTLEIESSQAEKAKIICGLDKNSAKGIISDILENTIGNLVNKIKTSINYYKSNFPNNGEIDKIILCGGGANIKGLSELIENNTKIKVSIGNSLLNLSENEDKFKDHFTETHNLSPDIINHKPKNSKTKKGSFSIKQSNSPTYSAAIGLALREIFINK